MVPAFKKGQELDEENELNQPTNNSDADTRHSQIFAYMMGKS